MGKVVTIPKDRNPFVVIVNGVEYKYPAGATIEVPDSVADVIEKYEGAKPKPDPNPAPGGNSGGSVQSDWNQTDSSAADFIKNKPFGDSPTGGDTLTWDGNTDGLAIFDMFGFPMYKISDVVPTMEDFAKGGTFGLAGQIFTFTGEDIAPDESGLMIPLSDATVVLFDGAQEFGYQPGIYSFYDSGQYTEFITINEYTGFPATKKLDEKYLPGTVILYADSERYLYETMDIEDSSKRITKDELRKIVMSGQTVWLNYDDMFMVTTVNLNNASGYISTSNMGMGDFHTVEYTPTT